MELAGI
jgi:ribonuclease-3